MSSGVFCPFVESEVPPCPKNCPARNMPFCWFTTEFEEYIRRLKK